jgi:menaquinone-dependent protoporphyrinogen oxidase
MARVLIVYSTKEGQTGRIAERMAATLREDGNAVQLHNAAEPQQQLSAAQFDGVLVGGSIHFNQFQGSLQEFVKQHRELLTHVPCAFFSVSLSAADQNEQTAAELRSALEKFFRQTGWRPEEIVNFAGALLYTRYNFLIRYFFKRIVKGRNRPEVDTSRDYDLTDWPGVDQFARQFGSRIAHEVPLGTRA